MSVVLRLLILLCCYVVWQSNINLVLNADETDGVDHYRQDGWWDPAAYIAGEHDPDPDQNDAHPFCAKSDCAVEENENVAMALSYDPINQLPEPSPERDENPGNTMEATFMLGVTDFPMECEKIEAHATLRACTTYHQGRASNLGGPFVGGEVIPRADACFNLNEMNGWQPVPDVNEDPERPLIIFQKFEFTLEGNHKLTKDQAKVVLNCYDGAAKAAVIADVKFITTDRKDDDGGGNDSSGGTSTDGDSDDDDSNGGSNGDLECEIHPLDPVGRILPRDQDGETPGGDGLPDWYEIKCRGFKDVGGKPQPNPETEVRFWDKSNGKFVHPDPCNRTTLNDKLDGLQDAETDFHNWTQHTDGRNQDGVPNLQQVEIGDGFTAWEEYRGFGTMNGWTRYPKFNTETTNDIYKEGLYASGLKKCFFREALSGNTEGIHIPSIAQEQEMPVRLMIHNATGAGMIPLPAPGEVPIGHDRSLYYPFEDEEVSIYLDGKSDPYRANLTELLQGTDDFAGAANFNNAVHSRDPFREGPDGEGMIWGPHLQCVAYIRFYNEASDPYFNDQDHGVQVLGAFTMPSEKLIWKNGEPAADEKFPPVLNAVTLTDHLGNHVFSMSLPIVYFENQIDAWANFHEVHAAHLFRKEIYYQQIAAHEMGHLLANAEHRPVEMKLDPKYERKPDELIKIFNKAKDGNYRPGITHERYYEPNVSTWFPGLSQKIDAVAMWSIYEPLKSLPAVKHPTQQEIWFVKAKKYNNTGLSFWKDFFGPPFTTEAFKGQKNTRASKILLELEGYLVHQDDIVDPNADQSFTKMHPDKRIWALTVYSSKFRHRKDGPPANEFPPTTVTRLITEVKAPHDKPGYLTSDPHHPLLYGHDKLKQKNATYKIVTLKRRTEATYKLSGS